MLRRLAAVVSILVLGNSSHAQVAPGFRLLAPLNSTSTHLMDTNGAIVHTWPGTYLPGVSAYLLDDGSLLRSIALPGGPGIGGDGGGVQRVALDGTVLWEFLYASPQYWSHHDLEPLPNGNVLMIASQNKTVAQAVAAGRDPSLIQGTVMRADSIIEVQPTGPTSGAIVWEWNAWDHLVQEFDPAQANHGSVAAHAELLDVNYPRAASGASDWNHMNSVKYDPIHDRIMVSARSQNEIYVIDHSTTTAQAAGHSGGVWGRGGDFLYRYGNPESYQAGGTVDRVFFGQHCARFIPPGYPGAGNFTVFNNTPPLSTSTVWEFTPPMDTSGNFIYSPGTAFGPSGPVWTYSNASFNTAFMGSAERLKNGNTLICSSLQGATFEVTPSGQIVWSYATGTSNTFLFHTHYVERTLWEDHESLSGSAGGSVTFDVIVGTPYAGAAYALLASASGTSPGIQADGITLPLNFDPLLVYAFDNANTPVLTQTIGILDANGRATATLNLPPGVITPTMVHFACPVVGGTPLSLLNATNAVPLTINP